MRRKGKFYIVTDRGDSTYAWDEDDRDEMLKLYRARGRKGFQIYELREELDS